MPETIAVLNLRKRPRQGRSRHTCEAILGAAERILVTDGLAGLNTNAVAARAGVSVGSLYQYFPGKEAILASLIREMRRDMLADFLQAVERTKNADLETCMKGLVNAALKHHLRNPKLTEALERAEDDLPMSAETEALKGDMLKLIIGVLKCHDVKDPDQTAFDLIAMCHGMVHASVQAGNVDFDQLSQRMNRAVLGYLNA